LRAVKTFLGCVLFLFVVNGAPNLIYDLRLAISALL
jgi:hypothetical protein